MNYQPATIANLQQGETGYQLDTGEFLAVSRRPQDPSRHQPNHVGFIWKARWVDAQGVAQLDHGGKPVEWEHGHSALQSGFVNQTITAAVFAQAGLDLVIQGGPVDPAVPEELHPDLGIRARILAVKAMLTLMT